jgi:hypothetical protein
MSEPADRPKTQLEPVRRHVAEGKAWCPRRAVLLEAMIIDNHSHAAAPAQRLLATMECMLAEMLKHLRLEEAAQVAYLARFGEDAPVSSYLDHRRLPDVLFDAVESGEQLTEKTLAERLGIARRPAPPPGAVE